MAGKKGLEKARFITFEDAVGFSLGSNTAEYLPITRERSRFRKRIGGQVRVHKMVVIRLGVVGAALACAAGLVVALPSAPAVAKAPKPPVTATCTSLFGTETIQTLSGCTESSPKAKITSDGVTIPNASDTGATIYWTDNKTTTETFTYTTITNTCPTYLGDAASTEIQESATITGGTAKLTTGAVSGTSNVCVYIDGSQSVIQSATSVSL
jgi:hypothetical protein